MAGSLPAEMAAAAFVFALGLRHGLDPDHLVAIDGLARSSTDARMRRWSGLFFSLGHGVVVTLMGVLLAVAATQWRPPQWLDAFGTIVSIGVLVALGTANLARSLRAAPPVGIRGRWVVERFGSVNRPIVVAGIGAAFAVSFDTVSHAVLFSATGATTAGWLVAAALGLVFTAGMVFTDALNGWWVARMIGASDARVQRASRIMGLTVAGLCFAIAAIGVARFTDAGIDEAMGEAAPFIGAGTLVAVVAAWAMARRRSAAC